MISTKICVSGDHMNIEERIRTTGASSFQDDIRRKAAITEARAMISRLETPWETGNRLSWIEPTMMACLGTTARLGLFERWHEVGAGPKSEDELSKLVACDSILLKRLLKQLATTHILEADDEGIYTMSPFSAALHQPEIACTVAMFFEINMPALLALPDFLASTGYNNPTDAEKGPFVFVHGAQLFDYLTANPKIGTTVAMAMQASTRYRGSLVSVFPTEELVKQGKNNNVLLVDCGGSTGHDIRTFYAKHAQPKAKLVLQDLPNVLLGADNLPEQIEKMPHDFFKPQPVKGKYRRMPPIALVLTL